MGIEHPNADVGAEMDTHRESIKNYNSIVTHDEHDKKTNMTTVEYIVGEGDPPFGKYRMTLELVAMVSSETFDELKDKSTSATKQQAAAE